MEKVLHASKFRLGACYYPEQWPESLWEDDFRRMREMGLDVIRVAEFAWSIFEPEEGKFDFQLFDRVMDLAHEYGLRVILGTPTATPPAWLTYRYPEVLNVSIAGVVYHHGERRHYNYNTEIYRDLSARIAEKMAEHYAGHPALLGWQIDNELNCGISTSYAPADHAAFRVWLQAKYQTLGRLNAAWGAAFWNQQYSDWLQVHLTRATPSSVSNPHQALDEKRFISESTISFAALQVAAIRRHDQKHWITTNGMFGHLDNHALTRDHLDFFSYDSYPQFGVVWPDTAEPPLLDRKWSANLSAVRGISPQFCVMEQQSGAGGWVKTLEQPAPKPGQLRLWTYQSVAHGADMVVYFRWRTASFGTEIYWHGINDYDNRPNRRCAEVARVAGEMARIGPAVIGSRYEANIAILKDYDNEWDGELDSWHGPFEKQSAGAWFAALQHRHIPVDVHMLTEATTLADLAAYDVLVYAHPAIMTERTADLLKSYAQSGGTIVFGCRTGYKNIDGHCVMRPMPGPVAGLCGVEVEEFTRIAAMQTGPSLEWSGAGPDGGRLSSGAFNDILAVTSADASVIATYAADAGHYAGRAALVENAYGSGSAYYFGGVFSASVVHALIDHIGLRHPFADLLTLPLDVEIAVRRHPSGDASLFLLNYASTPQTIHVHGQATDMMSGSSLTGEIVLEPYGVLVVNPQPSREEIALDASGSTQTNTSAISTMTVMAAGETV